MKKTARIMKPTPSLLLRASGFLTLLLMAASAYGQTITSISPDTAPQGTSGMTVTFTLSNTGPLPPAGDLPSSVAIGSVSGSSFAHAVQGTVTAVFDVPFSVSTGAHDAVITFTAPFGTDTYTRSGGFTVTAGPDTAPSITSQPADVSVNIGSSTTLSAVASGSPTLTYRWQKNLADLPGATNSSYPIAFVNGTVFGAYRCIVANDFGAATSAVAVVSLATNVVRSYPIVDTAQTNCYGNSGLLTNWPAAGEAFYSQDAQYTGNVPSYRDNGDGTITDNNTRLMWAQDQSSVTVSWNDAVTYCSSLRTGNYTDWRLPTVKELWSIRDFSRGWPWVNTNYFHLTGDGTEMNQHHSWTTNAYLVKSIYQDAQVIGDPHWIVNDWTGHIKAMSGNRFVRAVRGNPSYGTNNFVNNGDGTITDQATGLMWSQADNGAQIYWQEALAWVQQRNASNHLGHSDWRLPNIKELQSIADYSVTQIPAMKTNVFHLTQVTNVVYATNGVQIDTQVNYPFYWSSTSNPIEGDDEDVDGGTIYAWIYASGYNVNMLGYDLHGAGSVVFVSKSEENIGVEDSVPVMVRLVRDVPATADYDGDGMSDWDELVAGTEPTNALSFFHVEGITSEPSPTVSYVSLTNRVYTLYYRTNLYLGDWLNIPSQTDIPGSGGVDTLTDPSPTDTERFYRLGVRVP